MVKVYRHMAALVLSSVLLLCAANAVSLLILKRQDAHSESVGLLRSVMCYGAYASEGLEVRLDSAYVHRVIDDYVGFVLSGQPEFDYHPATEFHHAPTATPSYNLSRTFDFNVRPSGGDGVMPDSGTAIFCFGGSTTLGIFAEDRHTWPRFLEEHLKRETGSPSCVVNFGSASFNATQETNQFIYLLKQGHRPSLAIFLDGINTGPVHDGSEFSSRIAQRFHFDGITFGHAVDVLRAMPLPKLIRGEPLIKTDLFKTDNYDMAEVEFSDEYNGIMVNRFVENARIRKAIGELYVYRCSVCSSPMLM